LTIAEVSERPGTRAEGLPCELIEHREDFQTLAAGGGVEDEVVGPDVVGALGCDRHRVAASVLLLGPPRRLREALLAPEALDALAVDRVAVLAQAGMDAFVAPAVLARADRLDRLDELGLVGATGDVWAIWASVNRDLFKVGSPLYGDTLSVQRVLKSGDGPTCPH
jgi:hypothetical protein